MKQWTVPEVAHRLGLSTSTVRAYLARGQMPAATGHLGRTPWWSSDDIEAWMTGYLRGRESRERERANRQR